MFTPKTPAQTMLLLVAAFAFSLLIAVLQALLPELRQDDAIDWKAVAANVIDTILPVLIALGATAGLPAIGHEKVTNLTRMVGKANAVEAIETRHDQTYDFKEITLENLSKAILDENERRKNAKQTAIEVYEKDYPTIPKT